MIERTPDIAKFDLAKLYPFRLNRTALSILKRVEGLHEAVISQSLRARDRVMCVVKPDGATSIFSRKVPDDYSDFLILRPALMAAMGEHVRSMKGVQAHYGASLKDMSFEQNGDILVSYSNSDGDTVTIRTRCVIACDGSRSTSALVVDRNESLLRCNYGFGETTYRSNAKNIEVRSVVVDKDILQFMNLSPEDAKRRNDASAKMFTPVDNKVMKKKLSLFIFNLPDAYVEKIGGLLGTCALPGGHPLTQIRDVDSGYAAFEAMFPYLNVRELICEEHMRGFFEVNAPKFGQPRHRNSLAYISQSGDGGLLFLGDAAHSFPPDLGQGVNASFKSAAAFADVIDKMPADASVHDIVKAYEEAWRDEAVSVTKLHQGLAQFQYRFNPLGTFAHAANSILRQRLAGRLPMQSWRS